jgi:hypothetical protein
MAAKNELGKVGIADADYRREYQKEKQLSPQSLTRTTIKDA